MGVLSLPSGKSGLPLSTVIDLIAAACVLLAWGRMILLAFQKDRSRRPAREAARARPVTFAMPVKLRPTRRFGGFRGPGTDLVTLTVRGDLIEVASPHRIFRVLAQQEFYLDAGAVTFGVERGYRGQERISITGTSDGRDVELSVASVFGLGPIWGALTAAGAQPTSDPPKDLRTVSAPRFLLLSDDGVDQLACRDLSMA
jgi:hypothetical protein